MKKSLIVLIFAVTSLFASAQKDYSKFPSYSEIINKFFTEYSGDDRPDNSYITQEIKFFKKAEGWYVYVLDDPKNSENEDTELFRSSKTGKYNKLRVKQIAYEGENAEHLRNFSNSWSARFYDMYPYFGYPGWDFDIIKDFGKKKNLPDSMIYVLGRSYSSYAGNLLNNFGGFGDTTQLTISLIYKE